jgi:hypothetical protein
MSEITLDHVLVFLFVTGLLVFSIVFGVSQIRWCNEGMRTLKKIDKELRELNDKPPKEET